MDPGKPLIEYEVLGLVWEDATGKKNDPLFVPQYYVWHYPVGGRKPRLAKEVKLYSQTITQLNEDGEKYRILGDSGLRRSRVLLIFSPNLA